MQGGKITFCEVFFMLHLLGLPILYLIYHLCSKKYGTNWVRRKKIPFVLRDQILSISEEQRALIKNRGKKGKKKPISNKKTAKNP